MRVLILGATGLLGKVLLEEWDADELTGISSRDADIRDRAQLRQTFARCRPDCTVLAAAYTDVDGCERDPQRACEVNCTGTLNVALECGETGSQFLFVSSDYVFDGCKTTPYETDDAMNPINVYGQSKARAEKLVRKILPKACILRTSWLFGATARCFPNTILEAARDGKRLAVVDDQRGNPTYNRDLAQTIIRLCRARAHGTLHASNFGACTWYQFACSVLRAAGLAGINVQAIRSESLPRPARRPRYSVLSNASLEPYGIRMRSWQDAVADYINERSVLESDGRKSAQARTGI
jgi:dTDP-4-dehydrorhamnose reductase